MKIKKVKLNDGRILKAKKPLNVYIHLDYLKHTGMYKATLDSIGVGFGEPPELAKEDLKEWIAQNWEYEIFGEILTQYQLAELFTEK